MRWLLSLYLVGVFHVATAQWSVQSVPVVLKSNADAVVRRYVTDIKVFENNKINVAEDIVITILNEKAIGQFLFKLIVKDVCTINSFSLKIFDSEGRRIKLKGKDLNSTEINRIVQRFDWFKDIHEVSCPFTVEFEYKKTMIDFENLNPWMPVNNTRVNIQNASLRVMCFDTMQVQIKANNAVLLNNSIDEEGCFVSLWEINDFIIVGKEERLVLNQSFLPLITITKKSK